MENENQSDHKLLKLSSKGDSDAFRCLVERYSTLVYAVSKRILRNSHDVEDIFQATFLTLLEHGKSIRKKSSLASWLYGVAYRKALNLRTRKYKSTEPLHDDSAIANDSALLDNVKVRHDLELLDEEVNRLPPRLREPIVLYYLMGKSRKEVAAELGLRPSTVKGRLQRGKNRLRVVLASRGVRLGVAVMSILHVDNASGGELIRMIDRTVSASSRLPVGDGQLISKIPNRGESMSYTTMKSMATIAACCATGFFLLGPPYNSHAQSSERMRTSVLSVARENLVAEGNATFLLAKSEGIGNSGLLSYGDGKPDGRKSLAGTGELIQFAMPEEYDAVRAIKVFGSRYGYPRAPKEDFEIIFLIEDMTKVLQVEKAPYSTFKRGTAKWTTITFKKPVSVPKKFWVALDFKAERTKGVYVSFDTSTKGAHSRIGLPPEQKPKMTSFEGDWMIQAVLAKKTTTN